MRKKKKFPPCKSERTNLKNFHNDGQGLLYSYFLHKFGYLPSVDFLRYSLFELFAGRDLTNTRWTNQFLAYLVSRALKCDIWKL